MLDAVEVPPAVAGTLTGRVDAIDAVSDQVLAELIETSDLAREDAARIGLATSVHRLVGGEPATVAAVVNADVPAVPGGRLREARDLAVLDPDDWVRALESAAAPVPDGTTVEELRAHPSGGGHKRLSRGRLPPPRAAHTRGPA